MPLPGTIRCVPCACDVPASAWASHCASPEHARAASADSTSTTYRCETCGCDVLISARDAHERTAGHRNTLASRYRCDVCDCVVNRRNRSQHERGARHRTKVAARSWEPYRCETCECDVPAGGRAMHENGFKHIARAFRESYDAVDDRTCELVPNSTTSDSSETITLVLGGVSKGEQRIFVATYPGDERAKKFILSYEHVLDVDIKSKEQKVEVTNAVRMQRDFEQGLADGVYGIKVMCCFEVLDDGHRALKKIMKVLTVRVEKSSALREERAKLEPTSAYKRKHVKKSELILDEVVPAPKLKEVLSATTKFMWPAQLNKPESNIHKALYGTEPYLTDYLELFKNARQSLSEANYGRFFRCLLMMEEVQSSINIRQYDMENVDLEPTNSKASFRIHVPGLSESRPSVLRGDTIEIMLEGSSSKVFEGKVEIVEAEHCVVRFDSKIQKFVLKGTKVNVRFKLSRSAIELMQGAIKSAMLRPSYASYLLPRFEDDSAIPLDQMAPELKMLNRHLNEEQTLAVKSALAMSSKAPYVLFGPPGTGKTTTVVEIAAQLYRAGERVLIMAPSNAACDLFLSRVIKDGGVVKNDAFRVYNFTRMPEQVPSSLLDLSNYDASTKSFTAPTFDRLSAARVVAMTPMCAQRLTRTYREVIKYGEGPRKKQFVLSPESRFQNVIIDEAGHASEPELLAAIVGILEPTRGRLVLAGDARQLGPLVACSLAAPLEISTLERLCLPPAPYPETPYSVREDGTFDPNRVCMLTKNYRSHAGIIELPSRLFYFGKLMACADVTRTNTFKGWEELPNPSFPVVFHGVYGEEKREASSPSWFNPDEILVAADWISRILNMRGSGVSASDVCVVTPYHKQKLKMMKHLKGKNISGVTVGSTELLQGQEFSVVIITTTRSSTAHLKFDVRHRLGFMANPKRFNVAITRAKALLIVVGNPQILVHDDNWRCLLEYCRMNDSCTGCDWSATPDGVADQELADLVEQAERAYEAHNKYASYEHVDFRDN